MTTGLSAGLGLKPRHYEEAHAAPERIPDAPPWPEAERLAFEKESLGFFISGHPLERFRAELAQWANATTGSLAQQAATDPDMERGEMRGETLRVAGPGRRQSGDIGPRRLERDEAEPLYGLARKA